MADDWVFEIGEVGASAFISGTVQVPSAGTHPIRRPLATAAQLLHAGPFGACGGVVAAFNILRAFLCLIDQTVANVSSWAIAARRSHGAIFVVGAGQIGILRTVTTGLPFVDHANFHAATGRRLGKDDDLRTGISVGTSLTLGAIYTAELAVARRVRGIEQAIVAGVAAIFARHASGTGFAVGPPAVVRTLPGF